MRIVKLAACALNQTPLDWHGNQKRIISVIEEAKKQNVNILCLPELCITGYGCEDQFLSIDVSNRSLDSLCKISKHCEGITVSVGLPILYKGCLFNTSAIISNGVILGFIAKKHLASSGLHYEARWFKPGEEDAINYIDIPCSNEKVPFGDIHFEIDGVKIGQEICEDAWTHNRAGIKLAAEGVDVILNPSASHFAFGKSEIRKRFVLEGSRAFNCAYVYSNLLGNEAGRVIYDGDTYIASNGSMYAQGKRFSYADCVLTTATVDLDVNRVNRIGSASFQPNVKESPLCISVKNNTIKNVKPQQNFVHNIPYSKNDEFENAVCLGLFDYLRKSKSQGFVVSLSGGADSATVALMVYKMFYAAQKELGQDFMGKLQHINKELSVKNLLTCIYQASENSGEITFNAAFALAKAIDATFYSVKIGNLVSEYTSIIEESIERKLTWEQDDIALQNIQARVRSPMAWFISNVNHQLLLTTSNRSESAVGYATAGGDMSGGIAPIAGIDKPFIRLWLYDVCFSSSEKVREAVNLVVNQAPTAELRPTEQTDEADLMPYETLERIERYAILFKKSPAEIYEILNSNEAYDNLKDKSETLYNYIAKFFRLWCRNQWKREQTPLSFHLDDFSLDPRSFCRFPILNGNFENELEELKQQITQGK